MINSILPWICILGKNMFDPTHVIFLPSKIVSTHFTTNKDVLVGLFWPNSPVIEFYSLKCLCYGHHGLLLTCSLMNISFYMETSINVREFQVRLQRKTVSSCNNCLLRMGLERFYLNLRSCLSACSILFDLCKILINTLWKS